MLEIGSTLAIAKLGMPAYFERKWTTYRAHPEIDSLLMLYLLALIKSLPDQSPFISRYAQNLQILLRHGADPNVPARNASSTEVPILLRCTKAKEHYGSLLLTPWEFWVIEQEQTTSHIDITLQLLKAGAKCQRGSETHLRATHQLRKKLEAYSAEYHNDSHLGAALSRILAMLGPSELSVEPETCTTELESSNSKTQSPAVEPEDRFVVSHVRVRTPETCPTQPAIPSYLPEIPVIRLDEQWIATTGRNYQDEDLFAAFQVAGHTPSLPARDNPNKETTRPKLEQTRSISGLFVRARLARMLSPMGGEHKRAKSAESKFQHCLG